MKTYEITNKTSIFDHEIIICKGIIKNQNFYPKEIISGKGTSFVSKKQYYNFFGIKIPHWETKAGYVEASPKEIKEINGDWKNTIIPISKFIKIKELKK